MDRLTGDFKGASMFATVEQARQYNRLRQYEDTGLTPDEIAALRDENDRLCAALKLAQARARDMEAEVERLRAENIRLNQLDENHVSVAETADWKAFVRECDARAALGREDE